MHCSFVVVDCGKEMLAIETDADTVVSGTLIAGLLTGLLFAILVVPLHAADSTKTAPPFGARRRSSILNAASQ
jgi:hypothetical protein